ncbi:MAG: TonB-dependent receptor [Calditrichaeota bacterium]|nr:TonB-dependent receptor [Calditrichota bacterium]
MKLTFVMAIAIITMASSQELYVYDNQSNTALEAVVISINGQSLGETGKDGKFNLGNRQSGEITFSRVGYKDRTLTFEQCQSRNFRIALFEKLYNADEIVISASRFDEKVEDQSIPIRIIKSPEIQRVNAQTTADLLQRTASVFIQKSQLGGGSTTIRGFEANRVLLVVDGIRMNNAIYRGGHLQNVITLDNASLDRVEVIYGPGSVMYGSDALGGVMNFYTQNPILSSSEMMNYGVNSYVRYSTAYDEKTVHADFNIASDRIGSWTSVTYSDFGDLRTGASREDSYGDWGQRTFTSERIGNTDVKVANDDPELQLGSGYQQVDVIEKLMLQEDTGNKHILNLQFSTSSDINRYDRLNRTNGVGAPRSAEWYYGPQKRLLAGYQYDITKTNSFFDHAKFNLAYQNIEESRHDRDFGKTALNNQVEKLDIITFNMDALKLMGNHELRYGLEHVYNNVESSADSVNIINQNRGKIPSRYPDGGSQVYSSSLYITDSYEMNESLIFHLGARLSQNKLYSKFDDQTFYSITSSTSQKNSAFTYNLGLVYKVGDNARIKANYATGFRSPNVDDLSKVFETNTDAVIVPNPDLNPEKTATFDLGLAVNLNEDLFFEVTGFYTDFTDIITVGNGSLNGQDSIIYKGVTTNVIKNINGDKATIYGFASVIKANLTEQIRFQNDITYTHGRLTIDGVEGNLDHISPLFGKMAFMYHDDMIVSELNLQYNAWKHLDDYRLGTEDNEQYALPGKGTPSWWTLNYNISYHFNENYTVLLGLDNIFDQFYRVFSSGISAPGRNFYLNIKAGF